MNIFQMFFKNGGKPEPIHTRPDATSWEPFNSLADTSLWLKQMKHLRLMVLRRKHQPNRKRNRNW